MQEILRREPEEATTYAIFNITEDIRKFADARLITIAPGAGEPAQEQAVTSMTTAGRAI
ncbi:MAG: hypothetical protein MW690_001635 [Methanophagales archaeon]|nr:hypothetical protein [Methanophagales archaeon]